MDKPRVTLVIGNYDFVTPLITGDVVAEAVDLVVEREPRAKAAERMMGDPTVPVGEMSLGRHLARLAAGDRSFVAIPFFPRRAFRHRTFYVRRGSPLKDFKDLIGKRVGTNDWPASGSIWARAVLREAGVPIESIHWLVGSVEGAPISATRSQGKLPPYVQLAPPDRPLRTMLIGGDLDALMYSFVPSGFYEPDSPIVRLVPDFKRAEQEYYRRTGIYPTNHVVAFRQAAFSQRPWVARPIYEALVRSRQLWQEYRRYAAETTPWLQADIEDAMALIGPDWDPSGVEANRVTVQTLCDELFAQGLIGQPLDAGTVFTEFEGVMAGAAV